MPVSREQEQRWIQDRISELRGAQRLTYTEIARSTRFSKQYVARIADGAPASRKFIAAVTEAYGFTAPVLPGAKAIVDKVNSPTDQTATMTMSGPDDPWSTMKELVALNVEFTRWLRERDEKIERLEAKIDRLQEQLRGPSHRESGRSKAASGQ